MVDDDETLNEGRPQTPSGGSRRVIGTLGLVGFLRAGAKRAEVVSDPQIISRNPRSDQVADLAMDFAQSDREDDACARDLLEAAAGRQKVLRAAATSVRFAGMAGESRVRDRANRLLLAASTGTSVEPLSPELDTLFSRIEELYSVSVEDAYSQLAKLRPQLRLLEAQFGQRSTRTENEKNALWSELLAGLAPLIGPDADVSDPLLRSVSAHNIARLYFAVRSGLLDEVEYE